MQCRYDKKLLQLKEISLNFNFIDTNVMISCRYFDTSPLKNKMAYGYASMVSLNREIANDYVISQYDTINMLNRKYIQNKFNK